MALVKKRTFPGGVEVRPARFDDIRGILDINRNVFSGNDYLPVQLHVMLHDPEQYPYVVVANGEIVSFNNFYMLDNGKMVYENAARTKPADQGKGYLFMISMVAWQTLKTKYPQLQKSVWLGIGNDRQDKFIRENKQVSVLATSLLYNFQMRMEDLHRRLNLQDPHSHLLKHNAKTATSLLSYQEVLENIDIIEHFLKKQGDYFSGNIFFNPKEVNRAEVRRRVMETNCIATRSEQSGTITALSMFPVIHNASSSTCIAGITVYGASLSQFQTHFRIFVSHVIKCAGSQSENIGLFICIPQSLEGEGSDYLRSLLGDPEDLNNGREDFVLVNINIPKQYFSKKQ